MGSIVGYGFTQDYLYEGYMDCTILRYNAKDNSITIYSSYAKYKVELLIYITIIKLKAQYCKTYYYILYKDTQV